MILRRILLTFMSIFFVLAFPTDAEAKKWRHDFEKHEISNIIQQYEMWAITNPPEPMYPEYRQIEWAHITLIKHRCTPYHVMTNDTIIRVTKQEGARFFGTYTNTFCFAGETETPIEGWLSKDSVLILFERSDGKTYGGRIYKFADNYQTLIFHAKLRFDKRDRLNFRTNKSNRVEGPILDDKRNRTSHFRSGPHPALTRTFNERGAAMASGPKRDKFGEFLAGATRVLQGAAGQMAAANQASQSSWGGPRPSTHSVRAASGSSGVAESSSSTSATNDNQDAQTNASGGQGTSGSAPEIEMKTMYAYARCYEEFPRMGQARGAASDVFAFRVRADGQDTGEVTNDFVRQFSSVVDRRGVISFDQKKCLFDMSSNQSTVANTRRFYMTKWNNQGGAAEIRWSYSQ